MQNNGHERRAPKHKTSKHNQRQKNAARGGNSGKYEPRKNFQQHLQGSWPPPMVNYRFPAPVPMGSMVPTMPPAPLNMAHGGHVLMQPATYPASFGIPFPPPPITSAPVPGQTNVVVLPPITGAPMGPIFSPTMPPSRFPMGFKDTNCPAPQKPRFAPVPIPKIPIVRKMPWEKEAPNAIAIVDPSSQKDIRKEHLEILRQTSSMDNMSVETPPNDTSDEPILDPMETEKDHSSVEVTFLQENLLSDEEDFVSQTEFEQIVSCSQDSAFKGEVPSADTTDDASGKDHVIGDVDEGENDVSDNEVTIKSGNQNDDESNYEIQREDIMEEDENSVDTEDNEGGFNEITTDNGVDMKEDFSSSSRSKKVNEVDFNGSSDDAMQKVCHDSSDVVHNASANKIRYTLEFMHKFRDCRTRGRYIMDLNKCPDVIRDVDVKRTFIVNNLLPHYALKDSENVIITMGQEMKTRRSKQENKVGVGGGKLSPKGCAESAVKAKSGIIHVNLSIHEDVKLNEVENAWRPSAFSKQPVDCGEGVDNEKLLKDFRSVLNKITPTNFDALLGQVKQLKIITPVQLNAVIDLVFEKAVAEPKFNECYTKLCQQIAQMYQTPKNGDGGLNFRRKLITKVQYSFEDCIAISQKFDDASVNDENYDIAKKKTVGNIQFVGELFNFKLLSLKIMKECTVQLLDVGTSLAVELMCKLIATIGAHMDRMEKNLSINFIGQLKKIMTSKKKKFPSRIRFMVLDLEDLQKTWNTDKPM
ncbi:eukaryotic translation initiation factor 4 gamma 1-like [Lutzomyia longipalpis]|uniref:eukaryotic translation initiation factor 4 gamma 1-like n=1 Tax=Lutzomyia longipalpis TaxID=7200 RepID=UPI0024843CD7|nr:eukaryotic translation initiation factor 4 gamma 1-like [Lutzomyia longipalpis]